jgi:protein-tyrosine-phosphatase
MALQDVGVSQIPVNLLSGELGEGVGIRWGSQVPGTNDYVKPKNFPMVLEAQEGAANPNFTISFPVSLSSDIKKPPSKIQAYHGSAQDFDRFSSDYIGTGEGAQAYGYGHYLAESKGLGEWYRNTLASRKGPNVTHKGKGFTDLEGSEYRALVQIEREVKYDRNLSPQQAKEQALTGLRLRKRQALDYDDPQRNKSAKGYDEDIEALEKMDAGDIHFGGRLYEVDIDVKPEELLDWDKPLRGQSNLVRDVLESLPELQPRLKPPFTVKQSSNGSWHIVDDEGNWSKRPFKLKSMAEVAATGNPAHLTTANLDSASGADFYRTLAENVDVKGNIARGSRDASEILKRQGIKGIRYKDAQSRGTEGGTSNYVIFDGRLITISKKYGVAIPIAAAMLAKETGQDPTSFYSEDNLVQQKAQGGPVGGLDVYFSKMQMQGA